MSKNDNWMPLYIGDYMADTMHLNVLQHGAYLLLLMYYWRNGPLPNDEQLLRTIACSHDPKAWAKTWPVVSRFFVPNGDGRLHQKRMDEERDRWSQISDRRRMAGRAGADARYGRPKNEAGNCYAFASDLPASLPDVCQSFASDLPGVLPEVCQRFAITPLPVPKPEYLNLSCFKEKKRAREGDRPVPVAASRAAEKAELLAAGPVGAEVVRLADRLSLRVPYGPVRTKNQQLETLEKKPAPKPSYLTREQLNRARGRA